MATELKAVGDSKDAADASKPTAPNKEDAAAEPPKLVRNFFRLFSLFLVFDFAPQFFSSLASNRKKPSFPLSEHEPLHLMISTDFRFFPQMSATKFAHDIPRIFLLLSCENAPIAVLGAFEPKPPKKPICESHLPPLSPATFARNRCPFRNCSALPMAWTTC